MWFLYLEKNTPEAIDIINHQSYFLWNGNSYEQKSSCTIDSSVKVLYCPSCLRKALKNQNSRLNELVLSRWPYTSNDVVLCTYSFFYWRYYFYILHKQKSVENFKFGPRFIWRTPSKLLTATSIPGTAYRRRNFLLHPFTRPNKINLPRVDTERKKLLEKTPSR